jgi:hypothetical protein
LADVDCSDEADVATGQLLIPIRSLKRTLCEPAQRGPPVDIDGLVSR